MKESNLVLIVDDDPVFCRLTAHLLVGFGLQAESFTDPAKFIERAKATKPRLCIVDLNMGDALRGFEILPLLREASPGTPIFIVSGMRDLNLVTQGLELGASDYLVKPVDRGVLVSKLSKHLNTTELDVARTVSGQARSVEIRTELKLAAKIVAVDELGFTVLSPHLIAKGSRLRISGPAVGAISGNSSSLEVMVQSASLEEGSEIFRIYFEFEAGNAALSGKVGTWIRERLAGRTAQA